MWHNTYIKYFWACSLNYILLFIHSNVLCVLYIRNGKWIFCYFEVIARNSVLRWAWRPYIRPYGKMPSVYYPCSKSQKTKTKHSATLCVLNKVAWTNNSWVIKTILKVSKASFTAMQEIYLSSSSKIGLSSPDAMVGKIAFNPISSQERKKQNCSKERLRATKITSAKGFF